MNCQLALAQSAPPLSQIWNVTTTIYIETFTAAKAIKKEFSNVPLEDTPIIEHALRNQEQARNR